MNSKYDTTLPPRPYLSRKFYRWIERLVVELGRVQIIDFYRRNLIWLKNYVQKVSFLYFILKIVPPQGGFCNFWIGGTKKISGGPFTPTGGV